MNSNNGEYGDSNSYYIELLWNRKLSFSLEDGRKLTALGKGVRYIHFSTPQIVAFIAEDVENKASIRIPSP